MLTVKASWRTHSIPKPDFLSVIMILFNIIVSYLALLTTINQASINGADLSYIRAVIKAPIVPIGILIPIKRNKNVETSW